MATTKERLDGIERRLDAIDVLLDTTPLKPQKPKSAARLFLEDALQKFRQHWKVALPTIVAVLGVVGWFVNPLFKQHLDHEKEACVLLPSNLDSQGLVF